MSATPQTPGPRWTTEQLQAAAREAFGSDHPDDVAAAIDTFDEMLTALERRVGRIAPARGEPLIEYPATAACATTGAPRFRRVCRCQTYPGNWGACPDWALGGNGNCAHCDHAQSCHRAPHGPAPSGPYQIELRNDDVTVGWPPPHEPFWVVIRDDREVSCAQLRTEAEAVAVRDALNAIGRAAP